MACHLVNEYDPCDDAKCAIFGVMLDVNTVDDMEIVSGSRRELVRAATVASQWPVLTFGNIFTDVLMFDLQRHM